MAWRHVRMADDKTSMTIELAADTRVTGRLVDGRGRPMSGVDVKLGEFAGLASDVRGDRISPHRLFLWWSQLAPEVKTNVDGRFTIAGLPPDTRVMLTLKHDRYSHDVCYAATTEQPQPDLEDVLYYRGERREAKHTMHTGDFTVELNSAFHVLGRVLLSDTRQPCPEARIERRSNAAHPAVHALG